MLLSAAFLLALGLATTFSPAELLAATGSEPQIAAILMVQAAGGLYLGFAILNWMAKDNLIGGIYSRPVALGNFLHFFAVAMALIKAVTAGRRGTTILVLTLCYAVFAVWFGLVVFTNPLRNQAITNE
jgi:hypothetical protein